MVFSLLMIHPSFGGLFGNINCMKIYRICRIQDSEASTSSCLPSLGPPHRLGRWITSFWYLELYWFIGDAATNMIVGRTWFWSTSVHILRVLLVNPILWIYHLAAATIVEVRAPVFAVPWSHCVTGGVCAHSLQIKQTNMGIISTIIMANMPQNGPLNAYFPPIYSICVNSTNHYQVSLEKEQYSRLRWLVH